MTMQPDYQEPLLDEGLRRWSENLRANLFTTEAVALGNIGY